ncbi:MAG: galactokinase [Sphingobacteriaceae bacterium]
MHIPIQLQKKFRALFNAEPLMVRSPGRINLIGEHTDYNHGLVLPAAINKHIYAAIQKRDDEEIHLYAEHFNESYQTSLSSLKPSGKLWPDYLLGVVDQLVKAGHPLKGFNLAFDGDIPQGGGLSSSAALECATAYGLNELFGLGYDRLAIAKLSQAAENEFVGVKCGLMDQFASVFGKKQQLIKLDCDNFEYEYIPFLAEDITIVLFDTQVKHSLASSAYNERREQCEAGVEMIKEHLPAVNSLRDATEQLLLQYVKPVDELVYRRCTYVVAEIKRLQDACEDLKRNDFSQFGKRMYETHAGLKDLYEVSCPELDVLVDFVKDQPEVLGARMMGGGFGGCTINLVKTSAVENLILKTAAHYKSALGKELQTYVAQIDDGTGLVDLKQ